MPTTRLVSCRKGAREHRSLKSQLIILNSQLEPALWTSFSKILLKLGKWLQIDLWISFPFLVRRRQWHPTPVLLAWKIPWVEESGGLQSVGLHTDTTEQLHFSLSCIGEGNGNPLQCSCLENPRDGRAWWAAVYGVTQSRTRLKWLSSSSSSSSN